ncbi:MAG: response regulator [Cyanobacteria bacterium SID2]|nr:response regulator [Cyanobacteria bacterium SID2]MBP0004706.1 response regulator [Cyanobacteria bacterium SBC]
MTGNSPPNTGNDSATRTVAHPRKAIKHLVAKQASGCVTVNDPEDRTVHWQIFLRGGQLTYATSVGRKSERLQCLIRSIQPTLAKLEFSDDSNEYAEICQWWHGNGLPMSKLRQLLMRLSLEAMVHVLAMTKAPIEFEKGSKVDPILIETPLSEIPAPLWQMALQWQQWRSSVPSPFTRLYLADDREADFIALSQQYPFPVKSDRDRDRIAQATAQVLRKQLSLYRISTLLKTSVQAIVAWIQPFLSSETVIAIGESLSDSSESSLAIPDDPPESRPIVACIDDSKTVQKQVRGILEMSGYEVLGITEPAQALTALVRQKPAVILMDVNMPDIDGYELCSMLRQSRQLRDIPIIMLTGRDGILDRIRAKTLGVNYYLTKPFHPEHLVESIGKVLQNIPIDA